MSFASIPEVLAAPESSIPPDRLKDASLVVEAALAGHSLQAVRRMTGGASGAGIYKIICEDGSAFLLRLDGMPDGFRDPARHYLCQKTAASAGVAPALVHSDTDARISLSAFIETAPVAGPRRSRLQALGQAVRQLHAAPLFPALMPYFDAMTILLDNFASSGVLPSTASCSMLGLYDRIARAYPHRTDDLVSSHNDLNPGNVLFAAEQAMIIDWESAFAADRYVDLSAALNFFTGDEQEEGWLLEVYFDRPPTREEQARILLMRQVNRLFYAAMLIGAASRQQPGLHLHEAAVKTPRFSLMRHEGATAATPDGKVRLGCAFMNEALHEARSPSFESALETTAVGAR